MRKTLLFLVVCGLALSCWAVDARAQSSGTINVAGFVNPSAAVRWADWTPENTEVGANTPGTWNAPLDFSLDISDVAAGNNLSDYSGGTVQVILRSNTAYTLSGEVISNTGFGTVANGDLALTDVGFGITGLTNSGAKVFGDPANDATIAASFDADPSLAAKDVDEEPIFSRTLGDMAAVTQLMDGPRISRRGGRGSPNNGLLVDLGFAVGPQYYTPVVSFSADVELTLTTP